jgi:predicted nucleic acid-binding protein
LSEIYCLDSNALITHFKDEPGFEQVRDLLEKADAGKIRLYMSATNLTEVLYDLMGIKTVAEMAVLWQKIQALPLTVVHEITNNIAYEAARLKYTYRIALGDVFGLAAAKELKATFVTSDHNEMEQIEKHEPISFLWLPAKPKK